MLAHFLIMFICNGFVTCNFFARLRRDAYTWTASNALTSRTPKAGGAAQTFILADYQTRLNSERLFRVEGVFWSDGICRCDKNGRFVVGDKNGKILS
jgi:hypothetical protein